MTREKELQICAEVLKRYGNRPQIIKAIEEMSELTHALSRYVATEAPDAGVRANVCEEIADVSVMLDQLRMIFDGGEVAGWREAKLARLAKKLHVEEETEQ